MRPGRLRYALLFLLTTAATTPTNAAHVSNITAIHHDGQTFLTWTCPPGTGWTYRIYSSPHGIWNLSYFWDATLVSSIGDSTWCDRRLSQLTGTTYGYSVDSLATPLTSSQALFVITTPLDRVVYYCVTAESSGRGEDRTSFTLNGNTLIASVWETMQPPRMVYQRTLNVRGMNTEIYTLWASAQATPAFAAMANRSGMAYDCAVVRGGVAPTNSLLILPHARGGNFLQPLEGSGWPGEWRLTLDEPWLNNDGNTFWYGWHENYDVTSNTNTTPTSGVVRDYTMQRVLYTVLWARQNFAIDTTRVYASGFSMGGIGSVLLAFKRPDLLAGVMAIVGKFDFAFETDPNPMNAYNVGGMLRAVADRMWGPVGADLPTNDGPGVYQLLNDGWLAEQMESVGVPPIISFSGKNDVIVGWAEKIGFYDAMRHCRQGGMFFWDQRTHLSSAWCCWQPLQDYKYLYRFRTNLSYPAITNCSADFYPGLGKPASGDSVGTIGGFVEWDTTMVDEATKWETSLHLRDLSGLWQSYAAPESVTVDLTPRRLQSFPILPNQLYGWTVTRQSDGAVVQHGIEGSDSLGLLTLRYVKVYRGGSHLHIDHVEYATGVDEMRGSGALSMALERNPVVGVAAFSLRWPRTDAARIDLLDVAGRRVRSVFSGPASAGSARLQLDTRGLTGGVYFLSAHQGAATSVQRVVVLR